METDFYTHWRKTTHGIEKMTHLPETISRLYEACIDHKSQSWLMKLEGSGWLKYIETCMAAANKTVGFVSKDSEILLNDFNDLINRFKFTVSIVCENATNETTIF